MRKVQSRTLLLVEDEPMVRHVIARHLRKQGHSVVDAADAETALRLYRQQSFDALITDVHLPGMSGLDLALAVREIRADQPVIFVTGDFDEALATEAMAHEGAGYLLKPFEFYELDAALGQAIGADPTPPAPPRPHDPGNSWRIEQQRLLGAAARQPVDLRVRNTRREPRQSRGRLIVRVAIILIVLLLAAWGIGYWIASSAQRADQRSADGDPGGAGTIYVPTAPRERERGPDRR